MREHSLKRVFIPVVIAGNRPGDKGRGAMVYQEIGEDNLSTLRRTLAEEAKLQQVDPDEAWLRRAVAQTLKLYEDAYDDYSQNRREKDIVGFVQEFALPSGAELIMSDPCLLSKAYRIKAVEDQRRWN